MRNFLIFIFTFSLLTACGGDDSGMQDQKSTAAGTQKEAPGGNTADGKRVDGMVVVDHSQDEEEFRLRRSLGGVERMIEQYKQEGYNTDELEDRKAKLEKELAALTN